MEMLSTLETLANKLSPISKGNISNRNITTSNNSSQMLDSNGNKIHHHQTNHIYHKTSIKDKYIDK
jgi:hypothetical protein